MLPKLNASSSLERPSAQGIQSDFSAARKRGKSDFKHTAARIEGTEQKSGNNSVFTRITSSRWAKPIGYTALVVAAVGTASLAHSYWPSGTRARSNQINVEGGASQTDPFSEKNRAKDVENPITIRDSDQNEFVSEEEGDPGHGFFEKLIQSKAFVTGFFVPPKTLPPSSQKVSAYAALLLFGLGFCWSQV